MNHIQELVSKMERGLVIGVIGLALLSPAARAEGILACTEYAHDFGFVSQGAIVAHTFEVMNVGDAPVEITKIDCNLKLLSATIDKVWLAPDESAVLKMEYDSRYGMGQVSPIATLSTTDPSNQEMDFMLTGYVFNRTSTSQANAAAASNRQLLEPPARAIHSVWTVVSTFLGIK